MEERRVSENRNDVLAVTDRLFKSVCHGYGCSHAQACIHRRCRRQGSECIASDISQHCFLQLAENMEETSVRTSGAHERRSSRCIVYRCVFGKRSSECCSEHIGTVFALYREHVLSACELYAHGSDLFLEVRVAFFYNVKLIYCGCKILYHFLRDRIDQPHLEYAHVRHCLFNVLVAYAARDDSYGGVAHFHPVDFHGAAVLRDSVHALFLSHVQLFCHGRHRNVFLYVFLVRDSVLFFSFTELHDSSGV